jgi:hypothetical protein
MHNVRVATGVGGLFIVTAILAVAQFVSGSAALVF